MTRAGYDVVEAADGVEGINRFYEQPTDIDFDMAKKLGARTLDKPFALQELQDVISELLN